MFPTADGRLPLTGVTQRPGQFRLAFTLVEILVTMTLLSVIVLGLLMMFNQTQRAFRAGMGQTDVLEGGRGAIDMMVRELEQLTPSEIADIDFNNGAVPTQVYNFWTRLDGNFANPTLQFMSPGPPPVLRANVIQQFFLLTRLNQDWTAAFYRVVPDSPKSAVGSLYRYSTTWPRYAPLTVGNSLLYNPNIALPAPGVWFTNRVADGIVHLRLRVFDTNGVALIPYGKRLLAATVNPYRPSVTNAYAQYPVAQLDSLDCAFWNNAVPGFLELEFGILEPKTLQHYRAVDPSTAAAQNYLSNHVGQVHLFRQRIAIRNVDFSAYQ